MSDRIASFKSYCTSLTQYNRYKTREVFVGDIPLGADNPIRIQSMTTTNTMDTKATVEQTIRMVESGCEYVRITAPSKSDAENLANIKRELRSRGCSVPLVADIHFTPNAAEISARIVEKVRINPGNYVDKKKFESIEFSNDTYNSELERIRERFSPLVKICKEYGTAMRIGTNHGSLSDRIMSKYGDTPLGMVESALEFVRICEELNYYSIVLSMKASNPQVMIQAYRLLIIKMQEEGMNYPLHLGVTEAGGGEDGRIKSALGIGTLLEDGIGDTIRVSLTEDPEYEAPVAISIVNRYKNRSPHKKIETVTNIPFDPSNYSRRQTIAVINFGGNSVPRVIADYSGREIRDYSDLDDIGYSYDPISDKWNMTDQAADLIYLGKQTPAFNLPMGLKVVHDYDVWLKNNLQNFSYPIISCTQYVSAKFYPNQLKFIEADLEAFNSEFLSELKKDLTSILVITTSNTHGMAEQRRLFMKLIEHEVKNPVIIKRNYENLTLDELRLHSSTDLGGLLIDGFGDGVWLQANNILEKSEQKEAYIKNLIRKKESLESIVNRTLFGILQAARVRISKTEYIACPSCGRTLFDLQETTEMIRKRTEHLKGVKIAIMGCIVNGPGEMADADYGYVGSGIDRITLYRGKNIVRRNIPAKCAVDSLIEIIKEDNNWVELK